MNRHWTISLLCFCLFACNERRIADWERSLNDDFEDIRNIEELTEGEDARWKFFQQQGANNQMSIDTSIVRSGRQSLRFFAEPSVDGASKSDIAHNRMLFRAGETLRFSAWYYIEGNADLYYLFIADIEEDVAVAAGPGMRLALADDGYLVVERNKMLEPTLFQPEADRVPFPRDQWVEVRWEMLLSQKDEGWVKVWQDGQLLIDVAEIPTLPRDRLTLIQGTHNYYHSLQVGITANSPRNACVLYLDDVSISSKP